MAAREREPKTWLQRNRWMIIAGLMLFLVEVYFAFGWDLRGRTSAYWWFIISQNSPLHFYIVGLIGLFLIASCWLVRGFRWYIRVGLTVLFILPLPVSLFAGFTFPGIEYVGSATLHGHVYHLGTAELSGRYNYLHECDSFGFFCHLVDKNFVLSNSPQFNIMADPGSNAIYVVGCIPGGLCGISYEYYATGVRSP